MPSLSVFDDGERLSERRQHRAVVVAQAPNGTEEKLFQAASKGKVSLVDELLIGGACADYANEKDETPLHIAAAHNQEACVGLLLENLTQAGVNRRRPNGKTALHYAANNGSAKIVLALLVNGNADKTIVDDAGRSPLDLAYAAGHATCIRLLKARVAEGMDIGLHARTDVSDRPATPATPGRLMRALSFSKRRKSSCDKESISV